MKKKLVLMTSALMTVGLLAGCGNNHVHNWGEVIYTWSSDNSTCTAERVCKGDESHKETETANSTYSVVTEAKCEKDGNGRYSVSFKNEAFASQSKDVVIDALAHDYQFAEFVWTEFTAQAKYVCSHDASHVQLHDATMTNEVTTQPGCETEGVRTWTATYKDHSETKNQTIEALGHKIVHVEAKQAACEEDGNIEHWHCTVCEKNYSDSEGKNELSDASIPATGHTLGAATYQWSDDHTTCTAKATCSVCNKEVAETVDTAEGELESTDCYLYGLVASFKTKGFEPQMYDYYKLTLNDDKASYSIVKGNHLPAKVVIPNEINKMPVTKIGFEGFRSTSITSIVVSKNIVVIDRYGIAFSHSLISIDFEEGSKLERIESSGILGNYSLKSINNLPASLTYIGSLAINDQCTSITYLGTMEQWRAIGKGSDWNQDTPACGAIHCSDGDVDDHWVDPDPDEDDDW